MRELRGLIHAVAENAKAGSLTPILARLKRACRLNEDAAAAKARALAREILNDWEAITAFVTNPNLPPTNNDAETALRHAVIARRISFGTRTDEGSRAYAAILSVAVRPSGQPVRHHKAMDETKAARSVTYSTDFFRPYRRNMARPLLPLSGKKPRQGAVACSPLPLSRLPAM